MPEHPREPDVPLVIAADFSSRAYVQPAGDQLSGYLPIFAYQMNRYRSTTKRTLPFLQSLGSSLHLEALLTFADGMSITHVPAPAAYAGTLGTYRDQITAEGQTIHFTADLAVNRGLFPPELLDEVRKWSAVLALEGRNQLQFFLRRP